MSALTGMTQIFPIHENDEDLVPIFVPVHEVSSMVDTVLGNADTSSGKNSLCIQAGEHKQKYLIFIFCFFLCPQILLTM